MRRAFVVAFVALVVIWSIHAQSSRITAAEAKNHIGEHATVCGHVASTRYATKSKGQPTFLNLGKPYPDQIFTILIWGDDRPKFGEPETKYRDKDVCVTGTITEYRGTPEVVAKDVGQIQIQ
jgi:hypothetical protein